MSSFPKKEYVTTEQAGFWVAGQKIPPDIKEGKVVPRVGHKLKLTGLEAKYELAIGSIKLANEASKPSEVPKTVKPVEPAGSVEATSKPPSKKLSPAS
jgi:hypothetical protein